MARHSDSEVVVKQLSLSRGARNKKLDNTESKSGNRKYHTKSLSLSENRILSIALGQNLSTNNSTSQIFHQNRELWEKRSEPGATNQENAFSASRILSRNRIAPDLVMDLPSTKNDNSNSNSSSSLSLSSQEDELEKVCEVGVHPAIERNNAEETCTVADRFVDQNQCTLKKNEKFVTDPSKSNSADNLLGEVLHITETTTTGIENKMDSKSPIPTRNTQKFVSQFADLHLTGGSQPSPLSSSDSGGSLSSFKPHVKTKPQILKKPLVLPPTTPEMARRNQE